MSRNIIKKLVSYTDNKMKKTSIFKKIQDGIRIR